MPQRTNKSRWAPLILVLFLLIALTLVRQCRNGGVEERSQTQKETKTSRGLNRNPAAINFSKHARCRMQCRHITEAEVKDILKNGKINYQKSEIGNNPDCKRKYAVEGQSRDQQKLRIIFAPCQSEVTVVTVIDLGKEWTCDCE